MLTAAQFSQVKPAIDAAKAAADRADELVASLGFFTPDSARAAAKADAASTRLLADTLEAKLERWMVRPEPVTAAELADVLRSAGYAADLSTLEATAAVNDTGNMLATVGAETAADAGKVAKAALGVGAVVAVVVAGVVALVYLPRPRRA